MTSYNDFPSKGREKRQKRRHLAKRFKGRDRGHGKPRPDDHDAHAAHMAASRHGNAHEIASHFEREEYR